MEKLSVLFFSLMFCYVTSTEPECSKFHYEEQYLEKMIRTEIKFKELQKLVEGRLTEMEESRYLCEQSHDKIEKLAQEAKDVLAETKSMTGLFLLLKKSDMYGFSL